MKQLSNEKAAFLDTLQTERIEGLQLYWDTAGRILEHSGINLASPQPSYFSPKGNFFSALFLHSYYRQGIAPERRIFYAAVNQGALSGGHGLPDYG